MILHLKLFTDVTGSNPSHFASREESSHFTVKAGKEEAVLSQTVAGHLSDVNALVFVDNTRMIRYFTSADLCAVVVKTAQLLQTNNKVSWHILLYFKLACTHS